ncbi:MAG: hypothetical protein J4G19_09365, partial [Pseudomonadales bacterium]|nr:hypothetical protein [Pseudomonadales bacterium]
MENDNRRSFWTWGHVSDEPSEDTRRVAAQAASKRTGVVVSPPPIPRIDDIELRTPRLGIPTALADFVSDSKVDRIT